MSTRMLIIANEDADAMRLTMELIARGRCSISAYTGDALSPENVLAYFDEATLGKHKQYDVVVIKLKDAVAAKEIACAIIDRIPWQVVVVVGTGQSINETHVVTIVPDIPGVIAEIRRRSLIV